MKLELPRRILGRITLSIAGTFFAAMAIMWTLQDYLSEKEAHRVLERVLDDVQGQIEEDVNKRLLLKAMRVRDELQDLPDLSVASMRALAEELLPRSAHPVIERVYGANDANAAFTF